MNQHDRNDADPSSAPAPLAVNTFATFCNNAEVTSSPQAYFAGQNHSHAYGNATIDGGRVIFGNVYYGSVPSSASRSPATGIGRHVHRQPTSLFMTPRPSTMSFTGRKLQLEQLKSMLISDDGDTISRKVVVIYGLGGSGKTQFCLKYAEENKLRYWGVFWIDASTAKSAARGYESLGQVGGKGDVAEAGIFWLSKLRRPWLLILDNADDPDLDLATLLPPGSRGHILITSRNPSFSDYATAGALHLNQMDPEDAIELLLRLAYPHDDYARNAETSRTYAVAIADRLGYLAIALNHAGATIRRKIFTIEKYLTSYLARRGFLINHRSSFSSAVTEIITTWEIPFRKVEAKAKRLAIYEDAVALLHVFAFLHHQAVPEHLLLSNFSDSKTVISEPERLPEVFKRTTTDRALNQARIRQALHILSEYSIIEFNANASICSLHPVIHEWAKSRINNIDDIQRWLRCTAFLLANAGAQLDVSETTATPLLQHADSFLELVQMSAAESAFDLDNVQYIENIAKIYERAGRWSEALKLTQRSVAAKTAKLGRTHADTLKAKRNASFCHWNLFQVQEAIDLQHEILLAHWRRRSRLFDWLHLLRPVHTDYLLALSDLTQTLWLGGQRQLSRQVGERAVAGLRRQLGSEHPAVLTATFNLGRTYRHIGMLQEAQGLLMCVLKQRIRTLGTTHLDTAMVKNEVAMNLCSRKIYLALAEKWIRQVYEVRSELLGEEHAYTLWSVNDLSKILLVRGRAKEAAEVLEEIIPAVKRTLGDKHVGMQMTRGNLARAYAADGQWREAAEMLETIIPDMDRRHPDFAHLLVGLTRLYVRHGKLDEAEVQCLQALEDLESSRVKQATGRWSNVSPSQWISTLWSQLFASNSPQTQDTQDHINHFAGVLSEVYKRKHATLKLTDLRSRYPDLVQNILEQPFELT